MPCTSLLEQPDSPRQMTEQRSTFEKRALFLLEALFALCLFFYVGAVYAKAWLAGCSYGKQQHGMKEHRASPEM